MPCFDIIQCQNPADTVRILYLLKDRIPKRVIRESLALATTPETQGLVDDFVQEG